MKLRKRLQVGLKTFLVNDDGEFLVLLKGSRETYKNGGSRWDIPGGRAVVGKGVIENLKREVFEETGLKSIKILFPIDIQDIIRSDKHVVRITYISRVTSRPAIHLSEEHVEYKLMKLAHLTKLRNLDLFVRDTLKDKRALSLIKSVLNKQ